MINWTFERYENYRARSLWLDRLGDALAPRGALDKELQCDVAIIGGGLTGLWTAYTLISADFRRLIHMLRLTGINVTLELEPENAAGG